MSSRVFQSRLSGFSYARNDWNLSLSYAPISTILQRLYAKTISKPEFDFNDNSFLARNLTMNWSKFQTLGRISYRKLAQSWMISQRLDVCLSILGKLYQYVIIIIIFSFRFCFRFWLPLLLTWFLLQFY